MTASKPWEFDIPLNDHDDYIYRKKKYSPKHLRRHTIAMRPAILIVPLLVAFLFGFTVGFARKNPAPLVTVPDTVSDAQLSEDPGSEDLRYVSAMPEEAPITVAPEPPQPTPIAAEPISEPVRHRDDILSDGRLLDYDLQVAMQDCCEKYDVPYALALAVAEVESNFDPDAKSSTNDYGLMQINAVNFDWLRDLGMDPLTPEGNIESGVYILGQNLQAYGDPELALMAYNNGPGGAKMLWDRGIYQTAYSQKVMAAFAKWTSILETRP